MSTFLLPREPFNTWSHGVGFLLAVVGTVYLWRRSLPYTRATRFSLMVFGLSLIFCYAASTLFHGLRLVGRQLGPFDRLDRIGIFLLIAGTYTPLAWTQLKPRWRSSVLGIVWTISALACLKLAVGGPFPPLLTTGLYLGMGWGIIVCYAELSRVMTPPALRLLVRGGVLYTIGAVLNALHWPTLWPGVFDAHGLFHMFVIAASATHYRLMLEVVVPVPKPRSEVVSHRPRPSKPASRSTVHR
jgi:hemolysin III